MQRASNRFSSLILLCFFCLSCSSKSLDIIQAGPWFKKKNYKKIDVFDDRNKIKKPYGAIAVIHGERYVCSQKNNSAYLKKALIAAANAGADALVYSFEEYNSALNPNLPLECYLSGLAVKYIDEKNKNSF